MRKLLLILTGLCFYSELLAQTAELDYSYTTGTGFNGEVNASVLQGDGKLIVGGAFTSYNGTTRNYIARLNADGTLDSGFDPGSSFGAAVFSIAIQPSDGKIVVGGSFAAAVARLNTNGTLDGTFALTGTGLDGYVQKLALQSADEKVVIVGAFTAYNGTSRSRIARLNTNGTLDTSFDPGTGFSGGITRALAIQQNGSIIVVGGSSGFSSYNGTARLNIVRVSSTGAIDATYNPGATLKANMYGIALQSDGKAVVGGFYNGDITSPFASVARINTDGSIDNTFTPPSSPSLASTVQTVIIQSDNKIILAGWFNRGLVRINSNGGYDGFNNVSQTPSGKGGFEDASLAVNSVAVQSDGKIVALGKFASFNAVARNNIARLTTCGSVGITTHPASAIICENNNASFSVTATGSGLSYKWQMNSTSGVGLYSDVVNGGVYSGATTSALAITAATIGMNGYYYRCLVSDGTCTITSFANTLNVSAAPVINTQPTNKTICENAGTSFTIAVTNPGSYQWQEDIGSGFADITNAGIYSGATSATLTLSSAAASMNNYSYRCKVGSCNPTIFSTAVQLTVNAAPSITQQPAGQATCASGTIQFSIVASNATGYQWQEKIGSGSFATINDDAVFSGTATATLTITAPTITKNGNQYRCIATGANTCASTSSSVVLSLYAAPVVATHPADAVKCAGSSTSFSVVVTSPPSGLTYQWQEKTSGGSFANITNGGVYSNATTTTLNLTGITKAMDLNQYRCMIGSCSPSVFSNSGVLGVDALPVINTQPVNSIVCTGMTTSFSVVDSGIALTFQWQKETSSGSSVYANLSNSGIYSGVTNSTLTLTNVTVNDTGTRYRCVLSNGACTINSAIVLLTVRALPTINTQPVDVTRCEGQSAQFSASASFSGAPQSYQWQVDKGLGFVDLPAGAPYTGITSATLSLLSDATMNNYKYRCVVGSCTPSVISNVASLTINTLPSITTSPTDQTICAGTNTATFEVAAIGTALSYQWLRNGAIITEAAPFSGVTTSTLTITNVPSSYTGSVYSCRVSGASGCADATSIEATLTVNENKITSPPVFPDQTTTITKCVGESTSVSLTATGPALTFQWQEDKGSGFVDLTNDVVYGGVTTATLTLTAVAASMNNSRYRCVVSGGGCSSVTSNQVTILIPNPTKPTIAVNTSVNPETPTLTASSNASEYLWYKDDVSTGQTTTTITATTPGSYTVKGKLQGCFGPLSDVQAIIVTGDLKMIEAHDLIFYPNPVSDQLVISLRFFEQDKEVSISITDMLGRAMERTTGMGKQDLKIDVRHYQQGPYILQLQQNSERVNRSFVKQ